MGQYVGEITALGSLPESLAQTNFSLMTAKADAAFSQASTFINQLSAFSVNPVTVAANFTPPTIGNLPAPPADPTEPSIVFSMPSMPGLPSFESLGSLVPDTAPTFGESAPVVNFPAAPTDLAATPPSTPPTLSAVAIPEVPLVVLPEVPDMLGVRVPTIPQVSMPTFAGVKPVNALDDPNIGFYWDEVGYSSPLLAAYTNKIAALLTFDYEAEEQAIWERGQERINRSIDESVRKLNDDFAGRGFALPTGVLLEAGMELRAKGADQLADNAREAMIKAAEINRDKLAMAFQQGIALEGQLMTAYSQQQQRRLEAEKSAADVGISLFNARVSLYNAELAAYQADAQVYRDQVQGELAKLEAYRVEIEGQKLIGEINMQAVELYKARLSGVMSAIEVYKGQIDGVRALVESDRAKIDAFRALVETYTAQVGAKEAEYRAWGERVRAEGTKANVYESQARAFAAEVDAYRAGQQVSIEAMRAKIESNRNLVEQFRAQVEGFSSQVKAESDRVGASIQLYDGKSRLYQSKVAYWEANSRNVLAATDMAIRSGMADAELELKAADLNINQIIRSAQIQAAALEAAGRTTAQLAASALSAINISTQVSSSSSASLNNSLHESWSGTIPQATV